MGVGEVTRERPRADPSKREVESERGEVVDFGYLHPRGSYHVANPTLRTVRADPPQPTKFWTPKCAGQTPLTPILCGPDPPTNQPGGPSAGLGLATW